MGDDVDQLRANLAALKVSRGLGVRSVRFRNGEEERETEFKSDSEMAAAIGALERDIAQLEGSGPVRTIFIRSSKGL